MMERKYNLTLAELIDRLSILILKEIFIPENKKAYIDEQQLILEDINSIFKENNINISANVVYGILTVMLTNRYIWENESKARKGEGQNLELLKTTHSINGVRNTAKNLISKEMGERVDLKVDCLAADLSKEFGNWDIFKSIL